MTMALPLVMVVVVMVVAQNGCKANLNLNPFKWEMIEIKIR